MDERHAHPSGRAESRAQHYGLRHGTRDGEAACTDKRAIQCLQRVGPCTAHVALLTPAAHAAVSGRRVGGSWELQRRCATCSSASAGDRGRNATCTQLQSNIWYNDTNAQPFGLDGQSSLDACGCHTRGARGRLWRREALRRWHQKVSCCGWWEEHVLLDPLGQLSAVYNLQGDAL